MIQTDEHAMDPISARIEQLRDERGMTRTALHQLAALDGNTYRRRLRDGQWRTRQLVGIARALRVRVETLTGVESDAA